MLAPSSSAPIADTSTISLVRTNSRNSKTPLGRARPKPGSSQDHVKGKPVLAAVRFLCSILRIANVERGVAVIVPFESPQDASIEPLVALVAADMERVNATIISRTGSEVTMIPEVANHLISSGGKRLRPMLTLAMANLTGYSG